MYKALLLMNQICQKQKDEPHKRITQCCQSYPMILRLGIPWKHICRLFPCNLPTLLSEPNIHHGRLQLQNINNLE